jgi:hypothetical protein
MALKPFFMARAPLTVSLEAKTIKGVASNSTTERGSRLHAATKPQ